MIRKMYSVAERVELRGRRCAHRCLVGVMVAFALAACSGDPATGSEEDAAPAADSAAVDVNEEDDALRDATAPLADTSEEDASDTAGDTGDASGDVGDTDSGDADALDCSVPANGCPCDASMSSPCCLHAGVGLECSSFFGEWRWFYDCGCTPLPECDDYPLYALCTQ